ncbi:hypothetical protein [Sorangium sp. So ce1078]|uniref:hypothetical protein n=1 Tax=Sorangium sp. So ce1078 TaxID=3133329 RepID=UPI003F5D9906
MSFPIYHLETKAERCQVRVRLNDVPVMELTAEGEQPEWFAPPINLYLVAGANRLDVEVAPLPRDDGSPGDFRGVEFEGAVRVYGKGDAVAPGEGPVVIELAVMRELARRMQEADERDGELAIPQAFRFTFDVAAPDFAAELTGGEPLPGEEALRDYAILLRDLARAGDVQGLAAEMEPKVQAYAAAYDGDAGAIRASLRGVLQTEYAPRGFVTDFEREDVEVVPFAGGRLCELRRPGGEPLLQTPPDADENTLQIPVVIGSRGGALRVVR